MSSDEEFFKILIQWNKTVKSLNIPNWYQKDRNTKGNHHQCWLFPGAGITIDPICTWIFLFIFPKFSRFCNQKNRMSKNKIAIFSPKVLKVLSSKKIKSWKRKYIHVTWLKNPWREITFPKGRLPVLSSGKKTMWVPVLGASLMNAITFKDSYNFLPWVFHPWTMDTPPKCFWSILHFKNICIYLFIYG